jgi:hypothetical protein
MANQSVPPNVLFYMESCKTCSVFINIAQQHNILKFFKLICIDGQKEKFIAQGLKKVPTIIVRNIGKQIEGNDCLKWLDSVVKMKSNSSSSINSQEMYIPDIGLVNQGVRGGGSSGSSSPTNNSTNNSTNNQFPTTQTNILKRSNLKTTEPPIINNTNMRQRGQAIQNNQVIHQNKTEPMVKPINQLFGYMENEMSGFSDGYAYVSIDNPLPKSFLPPDKDLQIYTAPEGDKLDKKRQDMIFKNLEMARGKDKDDFIKKIEENNNKILAGDDNIKPKWYSN